MPCLPVFFLRIHIQTFLRMLLCTTFLCKKVMDNVEFYADFKLVDSD
jgi:hypothetical protein